MGNNNDGLKGLAGLAGMLNGMRASEEPAEASRPKGPPSMQLRHTEVVWRSLVAIKNPLPEKLEVQLQLGTHPKTKATQFEGFYVHGRDRLRVVCALLKGQEWPEAGEIWEVMVTKQIPGIVFANLLQKVGESETLIARRAKQAAKAAADLEAFRTRALGKYVELLINLPDDPQNDMSEVWNRVDHYNGTLKGWQQLENGVIEVTLVDSSWYRSESDASGRGDGRTQYLTGLKTFALYGANVEDRSWFDRELGERGSFQALCGSNPGRSDWDAKTWQLSVSD